jgi:hypothetical protein
MVSTSTGTLLKKSQLFVALLRSEIKKGSPVAIATSDEAARRVRSEQVFIKYYVGNRSNLVSIGAYDVNLL